MKDMLSRLIEALRVAFAPPRRPEPVSPLRLAADNYRAAMERAIVTERAADHGQRPTGDVDSSP